MNVQEKYEKLRKIYQEIGKVIEPFEKGQRFGKYVDVQSMLNGVIRQVYEDITKLRFEGNTDAEIDDLISKAAKPGMRVVAQVAAGRTALEAEQHKQIDNDIKFPFGGQMVSLSYFLDTVVPELRKRHQRKNLEEQDGEGRELKTGERVKQKLAELIKKEETKYIA